MSFPMQVRVLNGDVIHGPFNQNQISKLMEKGKINNSMMLSINNKPWISINDYMKTINENDSNKGSFSQKESPSTSAILDFDLPQTLPPNLPPLQKTISAANPNLPPLPANNPATLELFGRFPLLSKANYLMAASAILSTMTLPLLFLSWYQVTTIPDLMSSANNNQPDILLSKTERDFKEQFTKFSITNAKWMAFIGTHREPVIDGMFRHVVIKGYELNLAIIIPVLSLIPLSVALIPGKILAISYKFMIMLFSYISSLIMAIYYYFSIPIWSFGQVFTMGPGSGFYLTLGALVISLLLLISGMTLALLSQQQSTSDPFIQR